MNSPDPASLQNLNDIVLPAQVGWWPLASGWYFLIVLLLIVFALIAYRFLKQWSANRYRRAAVEAFRLIEQGVQDTARRDDSLRQIPVLLKRTALSVYPREQVASLTGKDWHQFLNSKIKEPLFAGSTAETLDRISYSVGDLDAIEPPASTSLLEAACHWLKHHQTSGPQDSEAT